MIQAKASSFDRISPTALMVAYIRQFTDIPYTRQLSKLSDAQAAIEELQAQQSPLPPELGVLVEARYKAINQVMTQFPTTQILELASGLLPRGMILSQDPNTIFIESDLPAMIHRKQHLVKQLIGDRPNLHFAAIDVTSQPSQFPLHADYLYPQKPITVICEGLLLYLTFEQKKQVFSNLRELLEVYGGVWITPDLNAKADLARMWRANPTWQRAMQTINRLTETSEAEVLFEDSAHFEQFVYQQGFQMQKHSMLNVLSQLTCLESLGIDLSVAESILSGADVFALTL